MKLFNIKGYDVVLCKVRNVYPVEEEDFYWYWGFKYDDGFYEYFNYKTEKEANKAHDGFISALKKFAGTK